MSEVAVRLIRADNKRYPTPIPPRATVAPAS
jgi:hypothetical protein